MFGINEEKSKADSSSPEADSTLREAEEMLSSFSKPLKGERKAGRRSVVESERASSKVSLPEEMFEKEAWEPIVETPFVLLELGTGSKAFQVTEKEKQVLAVATAQTAKYFLQIDPKWVVLMMFTFNWSTILGTKAVAYAVEQKQKDLRETASGNGKQPKQG